MSFDALTDAFLSVGGQDISPYCQEVTVNTPLELKDGSTMGTGTRKNRPGPKSWTISARLLQDFATTKLHDSIYAMHGTEQAIIFRPTSDAKGVNNPEGTGQAVVDYTSISSGGYGELPQATITLHCAGDLSWATA